MGKKRNLDSYEQLITRTYRKELYSKFIAAINKFNLVQDGDKICVCISGGKDSMIMAKLFQIYHAHGDKKFEIEYLVMNPGYNENNLNMILENIEKMQIPAKVMKTDIFEVAYMQDRSPCFLCAKMRRGALYNLAKGLGCNKIALGHHYDDVIETTLMNLLNAGSFQTMLPKLVSSNYGGMELIRPMYFIREKDIINYREQAGLTFIQCACKFTDESSRSDETGIVSQRKYTKELISELKKHIPQVEKNLFKGGENVNLNMILGYKSDDGDYFFLDDYEERKEKSQEKFKK